MFIGHFAVGLAVKKAAPKVSLGWLFMAVQFADLLWPLLLLLGLERVRIAPGTTAVTPLDFVSYPYSHSLLFDLIWGAAFFLVYNLIQRDTLGAAVLGACVVSHWVLDFVSHRPDVPLVPGGARYGLGLWFSRPATVAVEGALFAFGVATYARATKPLEKTGIFSFWSLVAFLIVMYLGNLFGPPPPSEKALALFANFAWLLVLWGFWIDRHRAGT